MLCLTQDCFFGYCRCLPVQTNFPYGLMYPPLIYDLNSKIPVPTHLVNLFFLALMVAGCLIHMLFCVTNRSAKRPSGVSLCPKVIVLEVLQMTTPVTKKSYFGRDRALVSPVSCLGVGSTSSALTIDVLHGSE